MRTIAASSSRQVLIEAEPSTNHVVNDDAITTSIPSTVIDWESMRSNDDIRLYRRAKALLHVFVLIVNLAFAAYVATKFSYVFNLMMQTNENNTNGLPMNWFFFAVLATEFGFSLVESVFPMFSWTFMRRVGTIVLKEKAKIEREEAEHLSNKENNEEAKKRQVNLRRLIGLSYPERRLIFVAFIMLLISSSTNIIVPYYFGAVVDAALKFADLSEMYKYIGYMSLVFLLGSFAGGIRSWLFELSGQRVVARLRNDIFKSIIKQDIRFFDMNRTGELTSRISSDTQVLQNAVTSNLSMLTRYIIQIVGSVLFMFSLQASLTGLLIGVIPIVTILTVQYGRYLAKLRKKFQDELATSNVISEESISSMRTIRSFGAEKKVSNSYEENIMKSFAIGKKLAIALGGFMGFVGVLSAGALSLILWYGGKLVHDQKITTGILASFLMYTLQVAMAFAFLSSLYGDFMQRIFEILDEKPRISLTHGLRPHTADEEEKTFDGSLSVEHVCFSYPTRAETRVLKDVSFEIEKGKTLALVGPSGGGKSTIFALIERFYDPDSGSIAIGSNRVDLKSLNLNWWHSKIALVSQEPVLFGGTIKENISFSLEQNNVDMEKIIEAAKLANAHDFITSFEKGYDTVVGERGIRLSGGQKQRIAIARALIVNPKLLLLDEATSALDSESEHLVQEAIERAMKDRTVCVIAHRLSTVKDADKVIVLDQGQLVEQGTHQELCDMDGIYKRLVLRQLLSNESSKND